MGVVRFCVIESAWQTAEHVRASTCAAVEDKPPTYTRIPLGNQ